VAIGHDRHLSLLLVTVSSGLAFLDPRGIRSVAVATVQRCPNVLVLWSIPRAVTNRLEVRDE
jgi:hypothetical protein